MSIKQKIFISSTYVDLLKYREKVWELLQAYNVDISGMEQFGARKEIPLSTCLEEVENADIYIGIIGMRYGSIDLNVNKSFTQIEYERACELNKHILIYLMDEDKCLIHPSNIDFENYTKLKAFKETLTKNHTVDTFIDENHLVNKLHKRLKKVLSIQDFDIEYRPQRIDCKIRLFDIKGKTWVIIIGYRFGEPFEVFFCQKEHIYLSPNVEAGWISKVCIDYLGKKQYRYDFEFIDSDGYKVTVEGVNRFNENYLILISKLLTYNVPIKAIIEIIERFDSEYEQIPKEVISQLEIIIKQN